MTYMSMPGEISPLVWANRLCCLPSLVAGFETVRSLHVSPSVFNAVSGPFADDGSDDHLIEFRAHLDAFLEGAIFTVSENPHYKPPETMLARVDPIGAEIWDLRSVAPHPGIRCLGGFWEKDVFVALRWDYRENVDWKDEIAKCLHDWADLFGSRPPLRGLDVDDYITGCDRV